MISNTEFNERFAAVYESAKLKHRDDKWGMSMMLPEHVEVLRNYYDEQKKVPRPELNEWDLEILQISLEKALKSKTDTKIKLWKDGEFYYNRGTIESVDFTRRTIELQDPFCLLSINLEEIVDLTIVE